MTPKYPEHEKLSLVKDQSQAIGEFLNWLESERIVLCKYDVDADQYFEVARTVEGLLANYFNIDRNLLEIEKQLMLHEIRGAQTEADENIKEERGE